MKKALLGLLVCIFAMLFTACSTEERTVKTEEITATVVSCKEGIFLPDEELLAEANICLAFGKKELYAYYLNLANEKGTYQYNVTISVDGENYTVSRLEAFEVGEEITVTATYTYVGEELRKATYE